MGKPPNEMGNCAFASPLVTPLSDKLDSLCLTKQYLFIIGVNVISEFIAGIIIPGNLIGNITFKAYATGTYAQAISLLINLKLGHYMKVYDVY
jgi:F0F1-type ATP synthase assembly protein I